MILAVLAVLSGFPLASPRGAVAAPNPLAAEAGAAMLRHGGNAVDAAVAAAFTLAVVEPESSGLGGGGFALVYSARDGKVRAIDFREAAPGRARPDLFVQDGHPRQDLANAGALSVAVPSAVRGYVELVQRFGKLPLAQIVAPAGNLASRGFQVDASYVHAAQERLACLSADPEAARIFLRAGAGGFRAPEPGTLLRQPDLARTIGLLGQKGAEPFYRGPIARAIVDTLKERGGIVELSDLAAVRTRELAPLESTYRGHRVVSVPLPSAGGFVVLALLNVLEPEEPRGGGFEPDRFLHVEIEAEKRLLALRQGLGDPAFNPGSDERVRSMTSKAFAATLRRGIGDRATPTAEVVKLDKGTSSLSVVDAEGNAAVITTTVNDSFGSCVVARGTGVLLNDEMDDFAVAPGVANTYGLRGDAENAPGPGKVPLSSMAPTLVFAPDGGLLLALGAAGGASIPTSVAQAIVHVIDDHMTVDRAIAAPRIHHNLYPDVVHAEPDALQAATAAALRARGHQLDVAAEVLDAKGDGFFSRPWGKACGVEVEHKTGWRLAACDPRYHPGAAIP